MAGDEARIELCSPATESFRSRARPRCSAAWMAGMLSSSRACGRSSGAAPDALRPRVPGIVAATPATRTGLRHARRSLAEETVGADLVQLGDDWRFLAALFHAGRECLERRQLRQEVAPI